MNTTDLIMPSLQTQIQLVESDVSRRLDGSVLKALAVFGEQLRIAIRYL